LSQEETLENVEETSFIPAETLDKRAETLYVSAFSDQAVVV
jgi:hypothetical protein